MAGKPAALLIADALALDFLNTCVAFPDGLVDFIDDGEGLLSWMVLAKLIDAAAADQVRRETSREELDAVAADARDLREWFREFVADRKGRRLTADAVAASGRLNALLKADDTFTALVAGDDDYGPPLRLRAVRRYRSSRALLFAVAEVLAKFLCDETLANVKACEGPGCRLVFADYSRDMSRRWCSPSFCGSPAWRAAHRPAGYGTDADGHA
jgi:predicted RNA-binding Zn ribbon-like protein